MMFYLLIGVLSSPCLIDCFSPSLPVDSSCTGLAGMAVEPADCDSSSQYRTQNGQCNNLKEPQLGAAVTPFRRLRPSSYDDGTSSPRKLKVILYLKN